MSDKPKCGCGNTQNPDGFCDGSHNNQVDQIHAFYLECFCILILWKKLSFYY